MAMGLAFQMMSAGEPTARAIFDVIFPSALGNGGAGRGGGSGSGSVGRGAGRGSGRGAAV